MPSDLKRMRRRRGRGRSEEGGWKREADHGCAGSWEC